MASEKDEKIVHVSTKDESGGISATVTTDSGNVYTGRDHPSYHWSHTASEDNAIRDAARKLNR